MRKVFIGIAAISLLVGACQTLTYSSSTMSTSSAELRNSLFSQVTPSPVSLRYRAGLVCGYTKSTTKPDGTTSYDQIRLETKAVRDRILIVTKGPAGSSTILISPSGHLFDFNSTLTAGNERVTPENFDSLAGDRLRSEPYGRQRGSHMINDLTLLIPSWQRDRLVPGGVAAFVMAEGGTRWASVIYRGAVVYRGRTAALFDVVRHLETRPDAGAVTVGFALMDSETSLPLVQHLSAGYTYKLEQTFCR